MNDHQGVGIIGPAGVVADPIVDLELSHRHCRANPDVAAIKDELAGREGEVIG